MPRGKPSDDPFYAHELPGLDGLNAASATCKYEENVCAYMEEQGMAPCERVVYILQKGSDNQRRTVLEHLGVTVADGAANETLPILQELNESMWQLEVDVQITGAAAIKVAIPALPAQHLNLLIDLTDTMLQLKEDRLYEVWSDVYVLLLKHLPEDVVYNRMIDVTLKKGELSEPVYSRVLCCRLIGGFCDRAASEVHMERFLEKVPALCQDTDRSVRAAMCRQFYVLASLMGGSVVYREMIIRELFDLLLDEEPEVTKAAFVSLMDLADVFEPPFRKERAYPVFKEYIKKPPPAMDTLLTENFGKYLWAVKSEVASAGDSDVELFTQYYTAASEDGPPATRRACAYNLPAVCASLPVYYFNMHLHPVLKHLASDSHVESRVCIAAGLHEITKLLGNKSYTVLKGTFILLLQDKDPVVQKVLIQNMNVVLDAFSSQVGVGEEKERYFSQLVPPLLQYLETTAATSIAKLQPLYTHLVHFPNYFSSAYLHGTFLPVLLKHLKNGPRALVPQCAGIIVLFCRKLCNTALEGDVFSKLIMDFGKSKSYWNRLSFIEICRATLRHYSRRYFRERFFEHALELSKDPVSAVRRRLCMFLPELKRSLKPPAEVELMANLIQAVSKLQTDTNPDVLEAIRTASKQVDDIEKEIRTTEFEKDTTDAEKEIEEQVLKEAAMEQDKLERRQKIREMLQNDRHEKNSQEGKKGKRCSNDSSSSSRLPPAPSGPIVRQPVGGVSQPVGSRIVSPGVRNLEKKTRISALRASSAPKR
eukprot:TRINITY_DN7518_c0_g1_i1.p1 TRINITY_DN7518_c0_g1~~TRINITY_DN7518_c0_g1_i1.p1  ORF type:complete len:764 (+),score=161.67 TRINITY_DN7518_c0_g1_i1:59-2350(+)